MEFLEKKKNDDLENIRKKIDELVGFAWERGYKCGYKCGQDDLKEPIEEEHELCVGDVVTIKDIATTVHTGIIVGFAKENYVFVNVEGIGIMIISMEQVTYTNKHINVLGFFNNAFLDIKCGGKEDEKS